MSHIQTHAQSVQDIMASVYGLADLLEQEGGKEGNEDETQMLGRFHRGCMVTAIKHLANQAAGLADIIEEQESASQNAVRHAIANAADGVSLEGSNHAD